MKNLILTGGFAALLLLGACGTEEDVNTEDTSDQTAVAEAEKVEDVEVPEEETEEAVGTLEEANEELTGEEGITACYGYNDDVVTEEVDTLNVTRQATIVMGMEVDSEMSWYFADEGYEIGDEVQMIALEYTVENTVEEQRDFYLDQTTIITSTGEQMESEWLTESGLQSEMLGAVESSGQIVILLRNDGAEHIEWVDVIIPSVSDDDWKIQTEEYKQRIEIKQ